MIGFFTSNLYHEDSVVTPNEVVTCTAHSFSPTGNSPAAIVTLVSFAPKSIVWTVLEFFTLQRNCCAVMVGKS